jgi:hypothetical protein
MKPGNRSVKSCVVACCIIGAAISSEADTTFTVDPAASWLGFMNVFELPSNGGAYVFGSSWGTADLQANFSGPILTLSPNTINDPSTFWYQGGGAPGAPGNKVMDANFYQEITGTLAGQTVTFTGIVLDNSLTSAHTSVAFIKDFAPDYSSSVSTTIPLTPGTFSISLPAINDPNRHVQFGFETIGVDVWSTDVGPFGQVDVTSVPEPTSLALLFGGMTCLLGARRNRAGARK